MNFEDYDIPDSFDDDDDNDESEMFKLSSKGIDECGDLSRLFLELCHYEYDYKKLYDGVKCCGTDSFRDYTVGRKYILNDIKIKVEKLLSVINELEG